MTLSKLEQLRRFFEEGKNVLILLPAHAGGDHLGAGLGLARFLEQRGIGTTLAGEHIGRLATRFGFLEPATSIVEKLSGARDFVIIFNTERNPILSTRTEQVGQEYRVYITPEEGSVDPRDFSFIPAQYKFDRLVALGAPDKESLGALYETNPDMFFEIPLLNIDRQAGNENYGQINWTDMTASSVSELVADALFQFDPDGVDEKTSECLLAGLVSATESFQKKNTTPRSLQIASRLMDQGADQQRVVRHLYKTHPFHLLKLWGRIMAGLEWNAKLSLVWARVDIKDIVETRSTPEDLPAVLDKIRGHYSTGKLFALLHQESPTLCQVLFKAQSKERLEAVEKAFASHGTEWRDDALAVTLPAGSLAEAEVLMLETLGRSSSHPE